MRNQREVGLRWDSSDDSNWDSLDYRNRFITLNSHHSLPHSLWLGSLMGEWQRRLYTKSLLGMVHKAGSTLDEGDEKRTFC